MAEGYTCDQCHRKARGAPPVRLTGVRGRLGLALPPELQERAFCNDNCFWVWIGNNRPQPQCLADTEFDP